YIAAPFRGLKPATTPRILSRDIAQDALNTAEELSPGCPRLQAKRGRRRECQAIATSHKLNDPLGIDAGRLVKFDVDTLGGPFDAGYPPRAPEDPQPGILEKISNRKWQLAKSVLQIAIQGVEVRFGAGRGNLLVDPQPVQFLVDEIGWNFQIHSQVDCSLHVR